MAERLAAAGAREQTPIATMPWGERMLYARDPFDAPISFVDAATLFTGTRRAVLSSNAERAAADRHASDSSSACITSPPP